MSYVIVSSCVDNLYSLGTLFSVKVRYHHLKLFNLCGRTHSKSTYTVNVLDHFDCIFSFILQCYWFFFNFGFTLQKYFIAAIYIGVNILPLINDMCWPWPISCSSVKTKSKIAYYNIKKKDIFLKLENCNIFKSWCLKENVKMLNNGLKFKVDLKTS